MGSRDDRHTFVDLDGFDGNDLPGGPRESVVSRFRVDAEIARGGLGRVHHGFDRSLDREVAIKALLKASPAARARFQRETLLTARLQHPNIVPVYDGGLDDEGEPFLAMRLVHGVSLTDAIDGRPTLEERLDLLPHVIDVCNAIAYAHSERIAHRDLKPDNILVGDFGEAVVIDWGIAKDLDAEDDPTAQAEPETPTISGLSSHSTLTRVGSVVGTPAYMPPEQAAGQSVEERADVYALGAVLYHVLAGVRPYHDAEDTLAAVLAGPPVSVDHLTPGVPPDLVAIVAKAMARLPTDRYADARELARDLNRFRKGRFVSAYAYTTRELVVRYVRAHPVSIGLSVALVLAVLGGIVGLGWSHTVVEAERTAAVRARDEVAALQAEERARLDALTLEQARLLMFERPAESIRLLNSLSDGAVFDGGVRSVAAAAFSQQPPRELPVPIAGLHKSVAVDGDRLAMATDHDLTRKGPNGWRSSPMPGRVSMLEFWEGDLLICTSDGAFRLAWDEEIPERLTTSCRTLSVLEKGVCISAPEQSTWLDSDGTTTFGHVASTGVITDDGSRWWMVDAKNVLHEYEDGVVTNRHPNSAAYALGVDTDGRWLILLHETPALSVLDLRDEEGRFEPVDIGLDWLVVAGELSSTVALVGGAGREVVAVDVLNREVVGRIEVDGSPIHMGKVADGQVFVLTDSGHAYVVEWDEGSLEIWPVSTPGGRLRAANHDGTQVVVVNREGNVYRQRLERPDGRQVHHHPGRIDGITVEDEVVWVYGRAGVEQLSNGRVTHTDPRPTSYVVRCGGSMAFGGPNHVGFWGGESIPIQGRATPARCVDDGVVVGTASGQVLTWKAGGLPTWSSVGFAVQEVLADGSDALLVGEDQSVRFAPTTGEHTLEHTYPDHEVLFSARFGGEAVYLTKNAVLRDGVEALELGVAPYSVGLGERMWIGDVAGQIQGWRDLTTAPVTLTGHRQYVQVVREAPEHARVASGGWDEMAWIWDVSDQNAARGRPLPGHGAAVLALAWSADGKRLYTGDHAGVVREWRDDLSLDPAVLRRQVHAIAESIRLGGSLPDAATLEAM